MVKLVFIVILRVVFVYLLKVTLTEGIEGPEDVPHSSISPDNVEGLKSWMPKTSSPEHNVFSSEKTFKNFKSDVNFFEKSDELHQSLYPSFSGNFTFGESISINKCCPWSTFFDPDQLICKETISWVGFSKGKNLTNEELIAMKKDFLKSFVKGSKDVFYYRFSYGVPSCDESKVFVSQLSTDFACDSMGPNLKGSVSKDEYCVDGSESGQTIVLTCEDPSEICKRKPCIRKCKPYGEFFGKEEEGILELPSITPNFYNLKTLEIEKLVKISHFGLYLGNECGGRGRLKLEPEFEEQDLHYLGTDGRLYIPNYEQQYYNNDEFCIEYIKDENISEVSTFLCFPESPSNLKYYILSAGFLISCLFLLATFLVYLFSPRSQNLYGKSLMCYIASLFSAYLTLAIIGVNTQGMGKTACIFSGYSTLFFFLSAFFWLNIMSVDIWKTFRSVSSKRFDRDSKEKIQFLWYSLYAWSIPCLLTGLCATADFIPGFTPLSIKPDIGYETCWFSKHTNGIYVFFITPTSLVIVCNTILYVSTAWRCWKIKSEIKRMGNQSRKKYFTSKTQFIINGKLFIVMGVIWSLEIISFFFQHPIWYITDAANALHGLFIFVIFVLKKKVLAGLPNGIRRPFMRMKNIRKKPLDTSGMQEDTSTSKRNFSRSSSTYVTDVSI